jgi:phosphoglycolate phosphatase
LAVATGKGRQGLERVWMTSQTGGFFDNSRCADEAKSKPSPDMLEQLLKEMRLDVNEAVMIGDSEFDMAMAKAINMDRIGVSYGVHSRERLLTQTPLTVIDQISELRKWI